MPEQGLATSATRFEKTIVFHIYFKFINFIRAFWENFQIFLKNKNNREIVTLGRRWLTPDVERRGG